MRQVSLCWVTFTHADATHRNRLADTRELLMTLEQAAQESYHSKVTGEESWFTYINIQDTMQLQRGTEPPTKPTLKVGVLKIMMTIFWNLWRIWHVDELLQRRLMNSQYFIDDILFLMQVEMDKNCEEQPESVVLHMGNAKVRRWQKKVANDQMILCLLSAVTLHIHLTQPPRTSSCSCTSIIF
ncbi:MAG: hypothetical protein EZS28_014658 [Streblomastix strix]|uniref:Uncharacterized protein n=1 Tax=Streblomastix strix TaxID=222440 RepID=A0A5J4W5C3_9EUKA|nr:MAG: hypothetical protein EZS28_014658 [Streblomastix strix]